MNSLDSVGATLQAALFAKSVAIAHVNAVAVVSGASMQGRILHVLRDALKLGAEGTVHANITQELSLADAASVINGDTVLPAVGIAVVRVAQEPAA
ncbi:hypothetical protein PTSG_03777 [Salpingoeca rosetta]|uniref:Uncharacterized protein n=1 Tax=Salpingoeca rosetta (strain ATCC 50818 / BSB-021) TaxID=946362 RepID=F2U5C5_SALR5|nr:uncharacterized protein PTSG_03777 [Salpingoeca rosetta]EGD83141.1 hypothetical protein PTSG_03777 [Salpingoeca rosetta]|eukprot:XP_004995505.1 hypothetical protein PTSG_03777 [Salpingoeca rosetta]